MPDQIALPDTIGYVIAQVCKAHRQRADELLNEIGLHVGQEMLLCALWDNEGLTQTELAQHLGVQPATVTNALKRLERKGLVERTPDEADQRVSRVFPTAEGKEVRADIERQWAELEQATLTGLSDEERGQLVGLLKKVQANLAG
jgi:DNA-binding MarR family transcriptional regulator